jgi:hypothetical protein
VLVTFLSLLSALAMSAHSGSQARVAPAQPAANAPPAIVLGDRRVRDAIRGGWVGGAIGGAWGAPTEFRYVGRTIPDSQVPPWSVRRANRYTFATPGGPDETYVEIPFLNALRLRGPLAGWGAFGAGLRRSTFPLFAANGRARENLRSGFGPPASGDPARNPFADNIDFQIESDFAGLVAPAQPGAATDLAWRAGHVVGYGDGVHGGTMVAAMHAAAFHASSIAAIVRAGRRAVPRGTAYREMVDDVIRWHANHPGNWKVAWRLLEQRWNGDDPRAERDPRHAHDDFNNDAKLNGGYVLLGLLYGHGDFARTARIAIRAGQDSDCNPNNAAAILGTWLGYSRIPRRFVRGLAFHREIVGTGYTLRRAIRVTYAVARRLTRHRGGSAGPGRWLIREDPTLPPPPEQWPIVADAPPQLDVSASASGRTVSFDADATDPDGIATYWWSFGDLADARGRHPVHTFRDPGTYVATAWASDSLGRTAARTVAVTVP